VSEVDSSIEYVLLKDMPNKRKFIFNVGLIFCIYTTALLAGALFSKLE